MQTGRARVNQAMGILQEFAGPCYPMLFLKLGDTSWNPVGGENLFASIPGKNGEVAVVLCDIDGNAKTMTAWLDAARADRIISEIEKSGIARFNGEIKLPI